MDRLYTAKRQFLFGIVAIVIILTSLVISLFSSNSILPKEPDFVQYFPVIRPDHSVTVKSKDLAIATKSLLCNVQIEKYERPVEINGSSSIAKVFNIHPENNDDLDAAIVFKYDEADLNGLSEEKLVFHSSTDMGKTWQAHSNSIVNPENNIVRLEGIEHFSLWTLAEMKPVSSPVTILEFGNNPCSSGTVDEIQYVTTSLGGYPIAATTPSPNVEGSPDGIAQALYGGAGSPILVEYDEPFSAGSEITVTGRYIDNRQGYIEIEVSTDGTSFTTTGVQLSGFNSNTQVYSDQSFNIPNSFTDQYYYLRLVGQAGNTVYINIDAVSSTYEVCAMYNGTVFLDDAAGGGTYDNGIKDGNESGANLPAGLVVNIVDEMNQVVFSAQVDTSGNYNIAEVADGNYTVVLANIDTATTSILPNLYANSNGGSGTYAISVVSGNITSPASIPELGVAGCEFEGISETMFVSSSLGGYNIGATTPSPNVEGTPDGIAQPLYGDAGSPITVQFAETFTAGAEISVTGRYIDTRQGYIEIEVSSDGTNFTTTSVQLSGFNTNAQNYADQSFVLPVSFTDNYTHLRLVGQTGNTVYINIDAVRILNEYCNPCPAGLTAPILSASTIANICPTQTIDLTAVTASNQPNNAFITWHTNFPAADSNQIADPTAVSVGIYYATFYNADSTCYADEGNAVTSIFADGDADCDGVVNSVDIDDDNDGILDIVECINSSPAGQAQKDLIMASYHSQIIQAEDAWYCTGDAMNPSGGGDFNLYTKIETSSGFNYTGTILLAATAGVPLDNVGAGKSQRYILTTDNLYVWGRDASPQIPVPGNNFTTLDLPVGVTPAEVKKIAAGATTANITVGILTHNGNLYMRGTTGHNMTTLRGNAGVADANGWWRVLQSNGGPAFTNVDMFEIAACGVIAYTKNYQFYTWGSVVRLGDGSGTTSLSFPTQMTSPLPSGVVPYDVDLCVPDNSNGGSFGGGLSYFVLGSDGKVYCMGANTQGQLGIGNSTAQSTWQTVRNGTNTGDLENVVYLTASSSYSKVGTVSIIQEDRTLQNWGSNNLNTIGGTAAFHSLPIIPLGFTVGTDLAVAVDAGGHITPYFNSGNSIAEICNVGHNYTGAFGDGTSTSRTQYQCSPLTFQFAEIDCDPDGDGIHNHLDLDSDGDGCYDIVESGAGPIGDSLVYSNNAMPTVGANGFADNLETSSESGVINYSYANYSYDSLLNACIDTDQDGIGDLIDIDDDNDGVLDFEEQNCNGTACVDRDTDMDGTPDHLDLDSDGDGCYDTYEAGVTGSTLDGGTFRDSLVIEQNTTVGVGSNGLADILEDAVGSNNVNYSSTYAQYALSDNLNLCADSDADGIGDLDDIDDDNDGVLDAMESPTCFATVDSIKISNITSSMTTWNATYPFSQLYDGATNTFGAYASGNGTVIAGETILDVELNYSVEVASFDMVFNYSMFNTGAEFIWQGSNDGGTWVELTDTLTENAATNTTYTYTFTQNIDKYSHYRIFGISGTRYHARIYELILTLGNFVASEYTLPECSDDLDGDGIYNHNDLDSDGDGCYDSYETAVIGATNNNSETDSLTIPAGQTTGIGTNGFNDALETNVDSDTINYQSTYGLYAIRSNLNLCADSDGDGIGDLIDIDDDNDGVLDAEEVSSDCQLLGGIDMSSLTFNNNTFIGIDQFPDSISIRRLGGSWVSSYSDQTITRPVTLEFTVSNVNATMMIGLIGDGRNQTTTNWNDQSHKFYFSSSSAYDIRDYAGTYNASSYSNGDVFGITIDTSGNLSMQKNGSVVYTDVVTDTEFKFVVSTASGTAKPIYDITFGNTDDLLYVCDDLDSDNDGIVDRLDLDSDGDGCYDSYEAGVTNSTFDGSITDSLAATTSAEVGTNGLADAVETSMDSDTIQYTSSYSTLASSDNLNLCADSDADGIPDLVDIDDDNDGILDATESPNCFATIDSIKISNISSSMTTWNASYPFSQLYDGATNTFGAYASGNGTPISGETLLDVELNYSVEVTSFDMVFNYSMFNTGAEFKWQASNDGNTWIDLTDTLTENAATNNTNTYTFTQNLDNYSRYRIVGISGTRYHARIYELIPTISNFVASAYTLFACTDDTDGDGVNNHLDLDSDGDGCFDSYEAGVIGATNNNSETDSLTIPAGQTTGIGTNGFSDALETNVDSDTINYESTYGLYATRASLDLCADSDEDGIGDLADIDDDNDGVLDAEEISSDCELLGGINLSTLTFNNGARVGIDQFEDSISVRRLSGTWVSSYTDQIISRPLLLEFTINNVNSAMMIGFIGDGKNQTQTNWNDQSHKFYFSSGSAYDIRDYGASSAGSNYVTDDVFRISVDASGNLSMQKNDNEVYADVVTDTDFRFVVSTASGTAKPIFNITLGSTGDILNVCDDLDSDNDGIVDRLDLDSDGDGCFDSYESGVTNATNNGSITDSLAATAATVGLNGYADNLETAENGLSNFISTYANFATVDFLNACADTDMDNIPDLVDIDDDNDGIRDSDEAPGCFYNSESIESGIRDAILTVSNTELAMYTGTDNPEELIDGNETTAAYAVRFQNATITDKIVHQFDFAHPIELSNIYIQFTNQYSYFNNATVKLQGSDDATNWIDLNTGVLYNTTNESGVIMDLTSAIRYEQFEVTQNADDYKYYRLYGVSGNSYTNGYSIEAYFELNNFVPELFPKTFCAADIDGDNIYNHLDLDSDDDGCSDMTEGGIGAIGDSLVTQLASYDSEGTNGLVDVLETNPDSDTINYELFPFAYDSLQNACLDTDGDEVGDLIDIDDDNDGVLDTDELDCFEGNFNWASWSSGTTGSVSYTGGSTVNISINPAPGNLGLTSIFGYGSFSGFEDYATVPWTTQNPFTQWNASTSTMCFSTPVVDPVLVLASIGQPGIGVPITFNTPYELVYDGGGVSYTSNTSLTGVEGYTILKFPGTHSCIDFSCGNTEYYTSFTWGINVNGACNDKDTDMDGIVDRLDLDSDNDGCFDSYEAGVTGATDSGVQTDSLAATTNAEVGSNGYTNTLETAEDGIPTYFSSYAQFANNEFLNVCADTDNDGIPDLADTDDDNDGIPDAIESPTCFAALDSIRIINVTSSMSTWNSTYPFSQLFDGATNTFGAYATANGTAITGEILLDVELNYSVEVVSFDMVFNYSMFNTGAEFIWQGSNNGSTWIELTDTLTENATTNNTYTYSFTENLDKYSRYRLVGISGTRYHARIYELIPTLGNFVPSEYTLTTCSADLDGDGIYNHLDLDSDGDGCYDSFETGVTNATNNGSSTDSLAAITPAQVGTNGLADAVETSTDSDSINYTSAYRTLASSDNLNLCADSDNDGIPDLEDIDDDNDGILDSEECPNPNFVANGDFDEVLGGQNPDEVNVTVAQGWTTLGSNGGAAPTMDILATPQLTAIAGGGTGWAPGMYNGMSASPAGGNFVGGYYHDVNTGWWEAMQTTLTGLTVDSSYTVFFYYANAGYEAVTAVGDLATWTAQVDGVTSTAPPLSFEGVGSQTWSSHSFTFTATNTSVTLRLDVDQSTDGRSGNGDVMAIDGIKVYATNYLANCPDTDNDGIADRLDLDSDGDGCVDAYEAGHGQAVYVDNTIATAANVGSNGLFDVIETAGSDGSTDTQDDGVNYTLEDNGGGTPAFLDNLTTGSACPPINLTTATDDILTTPEGLVSNTNVLTNDDDPEGDNQTPTLIGGSDAGNNTQSLNTSNGGTAVLDTITGELTYTPDPTFTGQDTVTYMVCDDATPMACDTANVFIDVVPAVNPDGSNNPPIAVTDVATSPQDSTLTTNLIVNDSDPDGDGLSVTPQTNATSSNGTYSVDSGGTLTYDPDPNFVGQDTITYEVCDDGTAQECVTEMAIINVVPPSIENEVYASDDASVGSQGTTLLGNVLTNDNDPEGDDFVSAIPIGLTPSDTTGTTVTFSTANAGVVTMDTSSGAFTYTPNTGFVGTENVTYEVCDDGTPQACDTATVVLTILSVPDTDMDGIPNSVDIDDDNDGIPDDVEQLTATNGGDTDGDGIPDHLDLDADNDGLPDLIEAGGTDTDGDGMLDDACNVSATCDVDGDGLMDSADEIDDSGNGSPTIGLAGTLLPVGDTDSDGQPDFQDLDADNDGINDIEEAGITDTDNNGIVDQVNPDGTLSADTDGDGYSDSLDPEDNSTPTIGDGSGTPGITTDPDANADGQPDDDDNDGTPYNADDTDSDGTPDFQDLDSDNDGIHDVIEGGNGDADTDGDGTIDPDDTGYVDTDSDGIPDPVDETPNEYGDGDTGNPNDPPTDTDNDNVPDYQDLDSDNDSINDVIEGGNADPDGDGLVDDPTTDSDGDGIPDSVDGNDPGFGDAENDPSDDPTDSDNDGTPDSQELDSDGDGTNDIEDPDNPGGDPTLDGDNDGVVDDTSDPDGDGITGGADETPNEFGDEPIDTDGDGIADAIDIDDDNDGIPDDVEQLTATNGGDTDGDGIPDHLDLDADNDGLPDLTEAGGTDTDGDGMLDDACNVSATCDVDGDGLMDSADEIDDSGNGSPTIGLAGTLLPVGDTDSDGQPDFQDLDADNDGINDIEEAGITDTDNNGIVDQVNPDGTLSADTDGDGYSDSLDPEDNSTPTIGDGSGTPGITTDPDANADGQPDDDDNDGTPYNADDTDSDGTPDFQDLDSDNDGIHDVIEGGNGDADTDGDGTIDPDDTGYVDTDSDGIPDPVDETPNEYGDGDTGNPNDPPTDTDNDNVPDYQDLDSDNDSINDVIEGGNADPDGDGLVDDPTTDSDGDGIPDSVDGNDPGFGDAENDPSDDPTDSDNDGTPDSQELDSDGDGTNDIEDPDNPGGDPTLDGDNDGVVDDTSDPDGDGITGGADELPNEFGDMLNTCGVGTIEYAISNGTQNTTGYQWDDYSTPPGDMPSNQIFGLHRSTEYCETGGWRHYYNINEPDKFLFSIEMGSNATEIEHIDIRVAEHPESRYDTTATNAFFGMARDWHVKTVGNAALTAPVNVRFYYVPLELKTILDNAIALSETDPHSTAPTAADIVWFKKENFDPVNDVSADGSILSNGEGYTILTPNVVANAEGESEADNSTFGNNVNYIQFSGISDFSGGSAFVKISGITLPVQLTSFTGKAIRCQAQINWKTAFEEHFNHYEVQWSSDGREFTTVGEVRSNGLSTSNGNYQFLDNSSTEANYYRLKMVDIDGSFEYSDIIFVETACAKNDFTIYPNPIGINEKSLNIDFYALEKRTEIEIIDMLERVVEKKSFDVFVREVNTVGMDVSDLPSGTYMVRIIRNGEPKKFIIQD